MTRLRPDQGWNRVFALLHQVRIRTSGGLCEVAIPIDKIRRVVVLLANVQVVLIAIEDWVTKVRESHLEVCLHVIVSLVHVEAEEFLGESFETLSIQPTGSCLCSFAPLLDLLQRIVEFHCRLVAC